MSARNKVSFVLRVFATFLEKGSAKNFHERFWLMF